MPKIVNPSDMASHQSGDGWKIITLADASHIGEAVMVARHWYLDPGTTGPLEVHGNAEQLLYVIKGGGIAIVGEKRLPLERETVLWLEPGDRYQFEAHGDGLEILQGFTPGE